jgi:lactate permease
MLIIAWFFGGFIEGCAGFGTAPALAAPLLVGLGFPAAIAVAVSLICNTLTVPFGAAGTAVRVCAATLDSNIIKQGFDPLQFFNQFIDQLTAISGLSGLLVPVIAIAVAILAGPKKERRLLSFIEIMPLTILAGILYILPWRIAAVFLGPELPDIMGTFVGLPLFLLCCKIPFLKPAYVWKFDDSATSSNLNIGKGKIRVSACQAWLPYSLCAAMLLVTRIPFFGLREQLNSFTISIGCIYNVSNTSVALHPAANPGIMPMAIAAILFGFIWKVPLKEQKTIFANTVRQVLPAALAIAAGVAMVQIMLLSENNCREIPGMLACIAKTLALYLQRFYIIAAPFVGALGTFFAGSCTVSNILFAPLQFDTAVQLGYPEVMIVALQNAGGGIGSMIRITGVIAACAVVNLKGKEGKILLCNILPLSILCVAALAVCVKLYF